MRLRAKTTTSVSPPALMAELLEAEMRVETPWIDRQGIALVIVAVALALALTASVLWVGLRPF
jgi:hypothetical protein